MQATDLHIYGCFFFPGMHFVSIYFHVARKSADRQNVLELANPPSLHLDVYLEESNDNAFNRKSLYRFKALHSLWLKVLFEYNYVNNKQRDAELNCWIQTSNDTRN